MSQATFALVIDAPPGFFGSISPFGFAASSMELVARSRGLE
jgi:hypothetical protein